MGFEAILIWKDASSSLNGFELQRYQPNRYPFLIVDYVERVVSGKMEDKFVIETEVLSWKRGICQGRGVGYTNGEVACEAEMTITIPEVLKQYLPKLGRAQGRMIGAE